MGVLSSMVGVLTKTAERYEGQAAKAIKNVARAERAIAKHPNAVLPARVLKTARVAPRNAAMARYAGKYLTEAEKGVKIAGMVTGITPTAKIAGSVAIGAGRAAGAIARPFASNPATLGAASAAAGVAVGVYKGVRGTMRDMNKSAGDPVGTYADLSVRTAFSGNPADSRTNRVSASGSIPLYMGKR